MNQPQILVVPAGTPPLRLDVFLVQHAEMSRSKLQQHIKAGHITLNDHPVKVHHLVHPGDVVTIADIDVPVHAEAKTIDLRQPEILFEDENYLVVNKPAGLVVHGGPGIDEPTLADWAVAHDAKIGEVGDQPQLRPGIVHRLDRDVSGTMVIAKTKKAFDDLKDQFKNHTITKEYLALAYGRLVDQSGRIDFAIARKADKSGLMVARPKSQEGKAAETLFHVERYVKGNTLVRVQTLTGRSHQIRVHFKAIGHPLVGDLLYKTRKLKIHKLAPPRMFLHATKLAFDNLTRQRLVFEAPLPKDLAEFLAKAS
jgi:23S rRNA pseudouridine1911/1915/1917 synthase